MKYNYNRSTVKGLSVMPFLNMVKDRNKVIDRAQAVIPQTEFNANILAARLHPDAQYVTICAIQDHRAARRVAATSRIQASLPYRLQPGVDRPFRDAQLLRRFVSTDFSGQLYSLYLVLFIVTPGHCLSLLLLLFFLLP